MIFASNMHIQVVEFIGSFPNYKDLQASDLPEICFWGRSNVGKSSLINMICNRKDVAKVSSTPGKTQQLNLFKIDQKWLMMDLPGYGFAKVSKSVKSKWDKEIDKYLKHRPNLLIVFLLIDISISPQKIDMDKMEFMGQNQIPFNIIYTKTDKCTKRKLAINISQYESMLLEYWNELPGRVATSSSVFSGRTEIIDLINKLVDQY